MLNTLGDGASREAWRLALIDYFRAVQGELSEDSQERLERNPLRILDSKDPRDKAFVADAPKIDEFLSGEAQDFFGAVTSGLDAAGVAWTRSPSLVRGLDYYRHTAFEFVTDRLGAQGTVLGGGRYDGLMESLGGPPTPAVGWAAGIERLAMLVGNQSPEPYLQVIAERESVIDVTYSVVALLRKGHVTSDSEFRFRKSNKVFEKFRASGGKYALIIGSIDLVNGGQTVDARLSGDLADMRLAFEMAAKVESCLKIAFPSFARKSDDDSPTLAWSLLHR